MPDVVGLWVVAAALILGAAACGDGIRSGSGDAGPLRDVDAAGGRADAGGPGNEADAGSPPITDPPSLEELCGAVPATVEEWESCYLQRRCDGIMLGTSPPFADADECVQLLDATHGGEISFLARERARAISAERASIDIDAFTACLAYVSQQPWHEHFSAACGQRFTGTVADGESCYADVECKSPGASCVQQDCSDSCCTGICEPLAQLGDSCDDFYACEPGLVCSVNAQKCVSGVVGSQCADSLECAPELWCNSDGKCQADLSEGSPCHSITQCSGGLDCVGLGISTDNDPRCRRVTQAGDSCVGVCRGSLYCDGYNNANGSYGDCVPLPETGEPCSVLVPCASATDVCDPNLEKCIARPQTDESCPNGTCFPGLFCSSAVDPDTAEPVCKERLADGTGSCTAPAQCESYVCSGSPDAAGTCVAFAEACP